MTVRLSLAVVLRLAERVCEAEVEPFRVAAVDTQLEAVVLRVAGILRQADDAVALVGAERVGIDAGVRLDRACRQLVDVALALQVEAAAADVGRVNDEVPAAVSRWTPAEYV